MAKEKTTDTQEEAVTPASKDQRFYFPAHNLTITAATREDAEKELAEIIKQEEEDV